MPKTAKVYDEEFHFKLNKMHLTQLKDEAKKEGMTVSELMRAIIKEYFNKRGK